MRLHNVNSSYFSDCLFDGNEGKDGGGLGIRKASTVLERIVFQRNYGTDDGGALSLEAGYPDSQVIGNDILFQNNFGIENGGALFSSKLPYVNLTNVDFRNNTCFDDGLLTLFHFMLS